MGRGDKKLSLKMRQRVAQRKLKARIKKKIAGGKATPKAEAPSTDS